MSLVSCSGQDATDGMYGMQEHASTTDIQHIESMQDLRRRHLQKLERIKTIENRNNTGTDKKKNPDTAASPDDNDINDIKDMNIPLSIPLVATQSDKRDQLPSKLDTLPSIDLSDLREQIIESYKKKEIAELERAIKVIEEGYKSYREVKIKVFPIEPINSRQYVPYTSVCGRELKYATLENIGYFSVAVVDWSKQTDYKRCW